jgi:tape measure domain-containing protein
MTDRVIRVVLDSRGVASGVRRARGPLGGLRGQVNGLSGAFKVAAGAAAGFGIALGVREIIKAVDTFQSLQNRLRVVTDGVDELTAAQTRLFDISQDTRTDFEATVSLFSRASIAAGELGASQEELFRVVEITGKALAIQGGAASESIGALRQLSQSFSSGIVRGEEFNSILEGAFPLALAAARGLDAAGGSVGRLRTLVIEGKVTSEEFFRAILEGGEQIDEQFADTVVTIGQAFTVLSNSLLSFVGGINAASGAGAGAAQAILGIGKAVDTLSNAFLASLSPTDEVSSGVKVFATTVLLATRGVGLLADSLITVLVVAFQFVGRTLGAVAAVLGEVFFGIFGEIGVGISNLVSGILAVLRGDFSEAKDIFANLGSDIVEGLGASTARIGDILGEAGGDTADLFFDSFRELRDELIADTSGTIEALVELWDAGARDIAEAATGGEEVAAGGVAVDPEELREVAEGIEEFLSSIRQAETELRLTRDAGEGAAEAIRRYREDLALAAAENEIFGESTPGPEIEALRVAFLEQAEQVIASQRAIREEIEASELAATFQEQIEALEEEILLLNATNIELAVNAELRALAAGATEEQAARIRELTQALADEKDLAADALPTLQDFFDDVADSSQTTLAGIIADPLNEGLDELPFKFAQILQQLAADALAAEVFEILGNLGGGGGGGGFLSFVGGLFGGGFQAGGTVRGGQPILVGERGPEIFTPPGSGSIDPNININQAAQAPPMVNVINVTDPADIPSGIETPEGQAAIINVIQNNPEAIRRVLG